MEGKFVDPILRGGRMTLTLIDGFPESTKQQQQQQYLALG